MKFLFSILFTVALLSEGVFAQAVVPCDVELTYSTGFYDPPPVAGPAYNMSNTTVNTCGGTFYDPNGTGNYANNQLNTMTFCSSTAGAQLQFIFTLWNLETCCDYLSIYDGPNTSSPLLFNDDGSNSPGTVTSSNGCLTFVWDSDGSVTGQGWAATINCVDVPLPFDCNGGTVFLQASGVGDYEIIQNNNFNGGSLGAGWVATGGQSVGTACGPSLDGTPYYWASTAGSGVPQLTTVGLDVSCGGFLTFDLDYATQGGAAPCEGPDLPNEGVTLQYSTNGGATWTVIEYFEPLGGYDATMTSWNNYSFPIPPGAIGPNTQFQWIQFSSSGTCCDNWGIDNVEISSVVNCTPYWYDYSFLPPSSDNPNQSVTITSTTTFDVTYTNGIDACSTSVTVVVPPGTTADAGPDVTMCAGGSGVVIGASPVTSDNGATFSWSAGAGSGTIDLVPAGGTTTGQVTVSPAVTTTYTLTVTYNGCTTTDQVTVTVNPVATVNANIDQTVCAGGTITLAGAVGGGATSGTWTAPTGTFSSASNLASTYTPSITSGTVTLTLTTDDPAGPCPSVLDQMIVTVNPIPTVFAGSPQTVCEGTNITLAGTGATSYSWDNGVTQGIAFAPTATTTYTVTGTTLGCTNTSTVTVTVNPIPNVNAGNDISICASGSTTLTASGATTYSWSPGGLTTAEITVSPAATTSYTVTGTSLGCTATDIVTVTVAGNAPINAGPDVELCIGASTTLNGTGGDTYLWDNGLGNGNNFTISPASTTTYTVIGTDASGCVGTDAITVTINPIPTVLAGQPQTVCSGTAVTLSASGATSYSWDNGISQGVAFTPTATTTYTVTGTALGCTNTSSVLVTVNPLPTVVAGPQQTVCEGTSITLTASGASTYTWDNGVTQGVAFTPTVGAVTYTVTGTSGVGCTNTSAVLVTVNPLPAVNAGADQTLCDGSSVTLTGTGASTYTWNNGAAQGVAFTPAVGSVTYTVSGTSAAGCENTDQVVVTINPNPTPIINGPTDYCIGNPALLSTSVPFTTYNWSTAVSTATTSVTIANNPITVTVTNAFGCTGTSPAFIVNENLIITSNSTQTICQGQSVLIHGVAQTVAGVYSQTFTTAGCDSVSNVTLVVNPLPSVNAGIDQMVCTPTATTLTATGAATYTWNNGITNGVPFTQAVGTTTYTVTGTSVDGCVNTDQVDITVNPLPIVNAGPDQAICIGASATISGSGATTYTWNNSVTDNVAFTPALTNTYTVTGTDINGCVNTDQVVVTVNPLPTVVGGPDEIICIGASVTLSGSGATSYTWDNGVTNGIAFSPVTTTTYTVTGTDVNGCINTDQVLVTVNPLPVVNAGPDQDVCQGTVVTLSGGGASTYSWNNGAVNGTPFTQAVGTVTYTVTGTDANGCINTDQADITVNPTPVVNAGLDQIVCIGASVTLAGSGTSTYSWNNGITNNVAFTPSLGTVTYTVTGTSIEGCITTDDVVVTVNPLPVVFAGNDVTVCEESTVTLTGSGASNYSWNNGVLNGTPFTPSVGTTTYTVTGTSAAGCINTDQIDIIVNPIPIVSFSPDVTSGCAPLTVNLTNTTPNSVNCLWTISNGTVLNGCGTVPVTFTQGGCYDVTLTTTSNNGCAGTLTSTNLICVEALPIASFSPSSNTVTTINTEVIFTNQTIGATSYYWTFGDDSPSSTDFNQIHVYPDSETANYLVTLIAYSPLGCTDTALAYINVVEELIYYVPNTFTPDDDNFNPVFQPIFTAGFDPYDYTLLIFNRWGEIIFESKDASIGWNGTYGSNGEIQMCQDGTYTWKIEFKTKLNDERKMILGHVNLVR